jgi:hypothetical protein
MFDWQKYLPLHPAAEFFPPMSWPELKELADDIQARGLITPIVTIGPCKNTTKLLLLDGRNRLNALASLGLLCVDERGRLCTNKKWSGGKWIKTTPTSCHLIGRDTVIVHNSTRITPPKTSKRLPLPDKDPYALVLSYNAHRRHLTHEQKREAIAKVLKWRPEASNRWIAEQAKSDHKTVGDMRKKLEATGEIHQFKKTTGKDGKTRKQPTKSRAAELGSLRKELCLHAEKALDLASFPNSLLEAIKEPNGVSTAEDIIDSARKVAARWTRLADVMEETVAGQPSAIKQRAAA